MTESRCDVTLIERPISPIYYAPTRSSFISSLRSTAAFDHYYSAYLMTDPWKYYHTAWCVSAL